MGDRAWARLILLHGGSEGDRPQDGKTATGERGKGVGAARKRVERVGKGVRYHALRPDLHRLDLYKEQGLFGNLYRLLWVIAFGCKSSGAWD